MNKFDHFMSVVQKHIFHFLFIFFVIFTVTYAILVIIDFVPEPVEADSVLPTTAEESTDTPANQVASAVVAMEPVPVIEEATAISIPSLNRTVAVVQASSASLADLDTALLSGVVRHPDSAKLGEEGNVVILGHSSYLPNVFNRNFQALNGAQDLEWGDVITINSDTTRYTYMVKKVYKTKASEAVIPTNITGQRLTLVTCNSFATDDDRFIIEADLLTSEPLV